MKDETEQQGIRGKQTKLTEQFIEAAREVIEDDINAVILTDEELITLINEKLPEEARIGHRTFSEWKAGDTAQKAEPRAKQFRLLLKRALTRQKQDLFTQLKGDDKAWQRWAWILERKFNEWNIRYKTDMTSGGEPITGFNYVIPAVDKKEHE